MKPARRLVDKRGDLRSGEHRLSIHEDNVATNAEAWCLQSQSNGLFACRSPGHQGGTGQHAMRVQLHNGAVDAPRQTEIICVDD